MGRTVRTVEDVLALLDGLFASDSEAGRLATGDGKDFWDRFYADRSKPVPFFAAKPDENLAACLDQGLIAPGRALDLGCGAGRNALFLASAASRWKRSISPRWPSRGARTGLARLASMSASSAVTLSLSPQPS